MSKSKVLLSRKLWEKRNQEERKRSIARYIKTGYPNYRIEKVIVENQSYIAVCRRE